MKTWEVIKELMQKPNKVYQQVDKENNINKNSRVDTGPRMGRSKTTSTMARSTRGLGEWSCSEMRN